MESTDVSESKEAKKKQEKDRKKGEKKMDQFIKSIANCTPDEKVEALCKKNSDSLDQIRTLKSTIQLLQRKIIVLEKEKEQLQNDQSKGVLARSRLETLCRELQRQNKCIKDESMQKIREEEEKRKEVSTRFQSALNEVSVMMQQNTDKNIKLRDDNIEISNKFQKLCDQFKQREEEVIRLTKQMDLEKQLAEATVKRTECQLNAERGIWNKEKEHYASQLKFHEDEKVKFESNIKNLEEHLSLYSNKYSDFESTIAKSNEVFDNYKVELNRMSKQIQKLEQENNIWKDKWIQSQHAFTNVTLEHRTCEQSMQERDKKLKQLADLCRSIQEERSAYLKQLKENGLTPVVVIVEKPSPPPAEPEKPKNNPPHKMTKKEKQLSLLKKEMQAIEKQLTDTLKTNKQTKEDVYNAVQQGKKSDANKAQSLVNNEKHKTVVGITQEPINNSENLPETVINDEKQEKVVEIAQEEEKDEQNNAAENTQEENQADSNQPEIEINVSEKTQECDTTESMNNSEKQNVVIEAVINDEKQNNVAETIQEEIKIIEITSQEEQNQIEVNENKAFISIKNEAEHISAQEIAPDVNKINSELENEDMKNKHKSKSQKSKKNKK